MGHLATRHHPPCAASSRRCTAAWHPVLLLRYRSIPKVQGLLGQSSYHSVLRIFLCLGLPSLFVSR